MTTVFYNTDPDDSQAAAKAAERDAALTAHVEAALAASDEAAASLGALQVALPEVAMGVAPISESEELGLVPDAVSEAPSEDAPSEDEAPETPRKRAARK